MGWGVTGKEIEVKKNGEWEHHHHFEEFLVRGEIARKVIDVPPRKTSDDGERYKDPEFESFFEMRGFPDDIDPETEDMADGYEWGHHHVEADELSEIPEDFWVNEWGDLFEETYDLAQTYEDARIIFWIHS